MTKKLMNITTAFEEGKLYGFNQGKQIKEKEVLEIIYSMIWLGDASMRKDELIKRIRELK